MALGEARIGVADVAPDAAHQHIDVPRIDGKALALARLAALIAIGGADPSFGEHADAAVSAGASADEIVDVLVGVRSIVGEPRVVAAAPQIALALGYDLDGAFG
jgi:alkylhydroperoxidase/carboxymuconolactone decarboxylase family protein YurZ